MKFISEIQLDFEPTFQLINSCVLSQIIADFKSFESKLTNNNIIMNANRNPIFNTIPEFWPIFGIGFHYLFKIIIIIIKETIDNISIQYIDYTVLYMYLN